MAFDPILALITLFLLGGLFSFSSWQKFSDLASFREVLMDYGVPATLLPVLVLVIPLVESSVAMGALISLFNPVSYSILTGAALLAVYTCILSVFYFTGRKIDCGCHFGDAGEPINGWHLVRNSVLIAMTLSYFLPQTGRMLIWVDYFTALVAAILMLIAFSIIETLRQNDRYFERVRRVN